MKYEDLLKLLGDRFYKDIPKVWISEAVLGAGNSGSNALCIHAAVGGIAEYIVNDLRTKKIMKIYKNIIVNYYDVSENLSIDVYDGDTNHCYRFSFDGEKVEIFNDMSLSWWLRCVKNAKDGKNSIVIDI